MEKLQWFKFSISEWKMGKIQRCNPVTKAMFMELCCLYWINETKLSIEDAIIECDEENYKVLVAKRIIKEVDGYIKIYFLDEQFETAIGKSVKARESVEKRWAKRSKDEYERNTNVIRSKYERNTEENRIEENRIIPPISPKGDLNEREKKFLSWFNSMIEKQLGYKGRFKTMTKTDKANLSRLRISFNDPEEWDGAFIQMTKNNWVIENKKCTVDHFLRNDNFQKYLNEYSEQLGKPKRFKAAWE